MYKTLINKDELIEQHKSGANQFSKIDKLTPEGNDKKPIISLNNW